MVLNSAGFHLNELSQVLLYNGPGPSSVELLPTANLEGVNISPSVLYSYKPSLTLDRIFKQPSKILLLPESL